ncbi:cytochrome c3 family protein [Roseomonas sp. SSH11]|uniref:Cytochrome c3 family protein n=1 Tax=Pararoseomonas baculiformis TaxID=2820812 RepID=A0ABS4ABS8_9PROT|nr:cytochrome c3 family protein [Pararoseomonas baculiformis]MBP0444436.1 cytochrome c3 family protein [Pararoseomonas baculiformis]
MAQIFTPRADARLRLALIVGAGLVILIGASAFAWVRSGTAWAVGEPAPQPIPFSHAVHAGGLGLDCRFCHAGVERMAGAGMPSAETCLGCHDRVWNVTAQFAPLRAALARGAPVQWSSVSRLPDHARFDHSAHTQAGVACSTCHGEVQEMPRTVKAETLNMGFCLDCHRDPAPNQRPAAAVMARDYVPTDGTRDLRPYGLQVQRYEHFGVEVSPMTRCSTCHQ